VATSFNGNLQKVGTFYDYSFSFSLGKGVGTALEYGQLYSLYLG
jgi:hypothetical protein